MTLYEIILIGERSFKIEIDLNLVQKSIIKIKDETNFKEEENINENSLYGIFVKNLKRKLENEELDEKQYEQIIELEKQIMNK